MRRHKCEDVFGVQLAGNNAEVMGRHARASAPTARPAGALRPRASAPALPAKA